jgi:hypothetical protein
VRLAVDFRRLTRVFALASLRGNRRAAGRFGNPPRAFRRRALNIWSDDLLGETGTALADHAQVFS